MIDVNCVEVQMGDWVAIYELDNPEEDRCYRKLITGKVVQLGRKYGACASLENLSISDIPFNLFSNDNFIVLPKDPKKHEEAIMLFILENS